MTFNHIAVVGGGAWGTALALTCARAGRKVTLWEPDPAHAAHLQRTRTSKFLPGVTLDDAIVVAGEAAAAAEPAALLVVVPAQAVRAVAQSLAPLVTAETPIVVCAKGIERGSRKFMTEIIAACMPTALPAILSGPSFRPYHSGDVRGVEIGGAAKNVLAIAAGIVVGRGMGASAAAALTTRGFAELMRFGRAYGAQPETLMGLSGLGDLILTCSSPQSRNFTFGVNLGQGQRPDAINAGLAEGVYTAGVLVDMARERNVDMPIATAVVALLDRKLTVDEAIESLLTRPLRAEG